MPNELFSEADLRNAHAAIRGVRLPSVPEVVLKLNEELARRSPRAEHVAGLIASDVALAGRVVQLINSPLYGVRQEVESIHQATVLLGLSNIRNAVLDSAMRQAMGGGDGHTAWVVRQAHVVAVAAAVLARSIHGLSADDAYMAGLFHDTGILMLMQRFHDYWEFSQAARDAPVSSIPEETRRFGTSHAAVSFLMGRHWRLPENVVLAISQHHTPSCAHIADSDLRALTATLKLANYLIEKVVYVDAAREANPEWLGYRDVAMDELMLDEAMLQETGLEIVEYLGEG